jgi:hypothetical protein
LFFQLILYDISQLQKVIYPKNSLSACTHKNRPSNRSQAVWKFRKLQKIIYTHPGFFHKFYWNFNRNLKLLSFKLGENSIVRSNKCLIILAFKSNQLQATDNITKENKKDKLSHFISTFSAE